MEAKGNMSELKLHIGAEITHDLIEKQGLARFMEYPTPGPDGIPESEFVLMFHRRGKSLHQDFRALIKALMKALRNEPLTDAEQQLLEEVLELVIYPLHFQFTLEKQKPKYLVGFTILDPGAVGDPVRFKPIPGMEGIKIRAEPKARQPLEWLFPKLRVGESFKVAPGEIGATPHEWGEFKIRDRGKITFGALKPYFLEYFLEGKVFNKIRIVFVARRLPRIDPETKRPIPGKYQLIWMVWVPEDQTPYAVSKRAREEKWKPPEGIVPIPRYWIKEHPEEFEEWKAWIEGRKPKLEKAELRYSLARHEWIRLGRKGEPVGTRRMPQVEWFLRFQQTPKKLRGFNFRSNPLYEAPIMAADEGFISMKWLTWEGELKPREAYNPNKRLPSKMSIVTSGTVEVRREVINQEEHIYLNFKTGALKGKWLLRQHEPKQEVYVFERQPIEKAQEAEFVLRSHEVPTGSGRIHCDIMIERGYPYLDEWNIPTCPAKWEVGYGEYVRRKKCWDKTWFKQEGHRKVDDIDTYSVILDSGPVSILFETPDFMSMVFKGERLQGYFTLRRMPDGRWFFQRTPLPRVQKAKPKPLKPPFIESKVRPEVWVKHLYDIKDFSSCTGKWEMYLPAELKPPENVDVNICFYPRPGALPGALVQSLVFPKDKYTKAEVTKFNVDKYVDWHGVQIRGKKQ